MRREDVSTEIHPFDRRATVRIFRERLLDAMEAATVGQSQLARMVGVDRSTLSQLLASGNDRLPRADTVAAVASTLQVSADWLLGLTNEPRMGASILRESVEIAMRDDTQPTDANITRWHEEAVGYKIRYVPTTLPDLVKTEKVLRYEYREYISKSEDQAISASADRLAHSRMPEADMEICCSQQSIEMLAYGEGIWRHLDMEARAEQLIHMAALCRELYPRLRIFLFNGRTHYSVPYTIFGPKRAALFLGQLFFVFNTTEHIRTLTEHFDGLIRAATIQANEIADYLDGLSEQCLRDTPRPMTDGMADTASADRSDDLEGGEPSS